MGGVSTSVANDLKPSAVRIKESDDGDEYLITRFDHCLPPINVIAIYGMQESREGKDNVLKSWYGLKKDLDVIKLRGEGCLLIGDLNRKIGNDQWGVKGNHSEVSMGGQLLRDLFASEDYALINNSDKCVGGPFTREEPGDKDNKSCLDLAIASVNLLPFIKSMEIDSKREFTPMRAVSRGKGKGLRVIHADHYPFVLDRASKRRDPGI
jgi:hypothetical protein